MATKRFVLEPGGAPRLELTWKFRFKDLVVRLDGLEIGRVPDRSELKLGRDFALADGSTLRVQLIEKFHARELVVLRDGKPLPGSSSHPVTLQRTAYGVLYAIGGFTAIVGVLAIVSKDEKLGGVDGGIGMLVEAVIYALLAWRVSKRSLVALYIALALFALDTVLTLGAGSGRGILIRIVVFVALIRAIPAIKELRLRNNAPTVPA